MLKNVKIKKLALLGLVLAAAILLLSLNEKIPAAEEAIYFKAGERHRVALTFETLWTTSDLEEILAILEREAVPATFFVTGTWLQRNPEAVKQILAGGHEIGNHTLNHRVMLQLESREIVREIKEFNDLALSLLEYRPRLFRPPLGLYNDAVVKKARQQGCRTVLWSVESYDLISKGSEEIVERVKGCLRGGSIVVFRVGAPFLPEALVEIIADLKRRGFEAVTVSELLM